MFIRFSGLFVLRKKLIVSNFFIIQSMVRVWLINVMQKPLGIETRKLLFADCWERR